MNIIMATKTREDNLKSNMFNIEANKNYNQTNKYDRIIYAVYELSKSSHIQSKLNKLKQYDEYTFKHCINVALKATLLGVELGYKGTDLKSLATGALIHDIGKQKVPLEILNKKGKLTPVEMEIIRKHPSEGYNIIKGDTHISKRAKEIVYQHHEDYNGTGYPRGLHGNEIDELAMIVHICDVYDALVNKRSYKDAFTKSKAISIINEGNQLMYNPRIVCAFNQHMMCNNN